MKRAWILAGMCLMCLVLAGCSAAPAGQEGEGQRLVDADASRLPGQQQTYSLYFRLGSSPYLAAEERVITVERDETLEAALIRQLLSGPSATQTALSPLFPKGTELIAVSRQGDVLFVTFNEAFLSGYGAEKGPLSGEKKTQAIRAERQMCLDALTATLTDAGTCSRVQVLIHRVKLQGNSLRLEEDYLYLNGSTLPLEPVVRREESLYTPRNAAEYMLSLWMARDFGTLKGCIVSAGRPGDQQLQEEMEVSPVLTGFVLSGGQPSFDGQWAIVTADITFCQGEKTWTRKGYPFRLQREKGVWKMHYDTLCNLMTEE